MLEITPALGALQGVAMELDDCAFPLLAGMVCTDKAEEAFADAQYALLVGARPRGEIGIHAVRGEKDVYDFWDLNVTGTLNVLETAVCAITSIISSCVSVGLACNSNAIAPTTCGVAIAAPPSSSMTGGMIDTVAVTARTVSMERPSTSAALSRESVGTR